MSWADTVVLGFGKMAADCVQILLDNGVPVGAVYETEEGPFSQLQALCRRADVPFAKPSRAEMTDILGRLRGPTLIFSINNNYLFPAPVVGQENTRIINFHNALLPAYPGHGLIVPPWVIFNGETKHGVTWHLVDERIDAGRILCYEVFDVAKNDTALSLMMRCVERGIALFAREWRSFLDFTYRGEPQEGQRGEAVYRHPDQRRMLRRRELPNGGYLDRSWSLEESSRFLRGMDYGPFKLLPPPKLMIDGQPYLITRYRIEETPSGETGGPAGELSLPFDHGRITLSVEKEAGHG